MQQQPKPTVGRRQGLILAIIVLVVIAVVLALVFGLGRGPSSPSNVSFNLSGQPTLGNPNSKVTVVAFEDFKCPFCRQYSLTVFPRVEKNFIQTGKIYYGFYNFPFIGPDSYTAAVAAECVFHQKASLFWPYFHLLYRAQKNETTDWATPSYLVQVASYVPGVNTTALRSCIAANRYLKVVKANKQLGIQDGVQGTPSIFVNGKLLANPSYSQLASAINRDLKS